MAGGRPRIPASRSRRVRLRRVVADRFSQRHLLEGSSSQCLPVAAIVRRPANRLSGLGCRHQQQRPAGSATASTPVQGARLKRSQGLIRTASSSRPAWASARRLICRTSGSMPLARIIGRFTCRSSRPNGWSRWTRSYVNWSNVSERCWRFPIMLF